MRRFRILVLLAALIFVGGATFALLKKPAVVLKPLPSYAALGDSVAAGVGLDTASDSSACNRTDESYPKLVAKVLNFSLKNLACSGATINAGVIGNQVVNNASIDPQLSQLSAISSKPTLITITVGANDIGWTSIISECYTGTCGGETDVAVMAEKIKTFRVGLTSVLTKIQSMYPQATPHVILTSYYGLFPSGGANCSTLASISAEEQKWWLSEEQLFDQAVSSVVSGYSFAKLASVTFTGHELCTNTPWIQDLSGKAPLHPTNEGQTAIAKSVEDTYAKF